ncbi:uncharacterized protein [Halyomorpha halys]|uniref:uncharacterized protein isoform X1 n=1 Tax=Halyomorpha halys TaxID=286706 RepID=UPI0034D19CA6
MDVKKDIEQKEEGRKSYSKVGFMAVYGSMEAPKDRHEIDSLIDNLQPSDWSSNRIQMDCDNFVSASDACMKKRIIFKKRLGCPGGFRARLGQKLVRRNIFTRKKNIITKKKNNLRTRDWVRISVHPFINFLRMYRKKFPRNTPNEEIARRGRYEWRKMSCKTKEKFYEQAQRARMRGYNRY